MKDNKSWMCCGQNNKKSGNHRRSDPRRKRCNKKDSKRSSTKSRSSNRSPTTKQQRINNQSKNTKRGQDLNQNMEVVEMPRCSSLKMTKKRRMSKEEKPVEERVKVGQREAWTKLSPYLSLPHQSNS